MKEFIYVDPLSLPQVDKISLLETALDEQIFIEPPVIGRIRNRRPPEFIDDPGNVGLFRGLGAGEYRLPPVFTVAVKRATVIGYRTILVGTKFFTDQTFGERQSLFLQKLARADSFSKEDTGFLPTNIDTKFRFDGNGRNIRKLEGDTVVLCSQEPSNYGSFIFRVLPKLLQVKDHGFDNLKILVYAQHRNYRRLLEIAGVPSKQLVLHDTNVVTHIDRAIVPSLRTPDAFLDESSRKFYLDISDRIGNQQIKGRKIYVSRLAHGLKAGSTRQMLNEKGLIDALSAVGFNIIEPDSMSIEDQIKEFSAAELVVGPSGAGLFNVVFCRPGTKVIDIESELHWIYSHAGLFSSCDLKYGVFVGQCDTEDLRPVHRRWTVDIKSLVARVLDVENS